MSDLIRGNQLLRSGKLEEAVAAYQSAIAHNPSFHWSHYKLGEALEKLGHWEEAIANYKTAIKINPNSAQFQSSLEFAIEARQTSKDNINLNPNPKLNLALNKPTAQSSIYQPERYGYDPHGACNGEKTGKFGFHTLKEDQPWWQIDLQGTYQISQIKIYNRIDFKERASTLNILVSQDALNWELYYSNDPENLFCGIDGKPLIVDVPYKVTRFLRLQLRDIEFLHLDEVEIYGTLVKSNSSQLKCSQDEATLSTNFYRELRENLELEQRFAEQNGISLSSMRSQFFNPMFKSVKRTDTLKLSRFVEFDQLDKNNIIGDITALSIEKPGRFGNSIIQLSHAYQIAKAIGVYKIYLPNFWYIKSGETNTKSGIQIINVNKPNFLSEKIVLEGMFFYYSTLAPLSPKKLGKPNGYLNMRDLIEAFNLKHSAEPLGEQNLVIHIRSGDVFQKNPHSGYGQPPLSFYKKIVELQRWHSIHLVFEDKSNPIIQPLIDFCQHRCSLVQEISGDLRSDIEYLLKARILVVSRGSFSPAIATISKNLETVYYLVFILLKKISLGGRLICKEFINFPRLRFIIGLIVKNGLVD